MKKEKNIFRVLVIDDSSSVIDQLHIRITPKHEIGGSEWHVDRVLVPIKLNDDGSHISDDSISKLLAGCSKPFDLILADYGFVSSHTQWDDLADGKISPQEFLKITKTAADIVEEVETYFKNHPTESLTLRENFSEHLKKYAGKLYLYTYTSTKTKSAYPNVADRKKRTQNAFKEARVVVIDTQRELFDDHKYEEGKYDSEFYAYLVTGYLDNVVNRELLEHVLLDERDYLKKIRRVKGGFGLFLIAVIAGGVGSASSWIGETAISLFHTGNGTTAWMLIALALIILFAVGMLLPWILEFVLTSIMAHMAAKKDKD